jgi:hypothetical protein
MHPAHRAAAISSVFSSVFPRAGNVPQPAHGAIPSLRRARGRSGNRRVSHAQAMLPQAGS